MQTDTNMQNQQRQTDPVDGSNSGFLFIAQTDAEGEGGVMLFAAHLPACAGYK